MGWNEGYDSAAEINARAAEREAALRAQRVADGEELTALRDRVTRGGDRDAYLALAVTLARVYDARLHWVRDNPHAVRPRDLYVRFVDDDESLAEFGHELGHLLCEPCEGAAHVPFDEDGVRTCLRCELAAWDKALELLPFSPAAFQRLQRAVASYRTTPAPQAVRQQADRLVSESTLTDHQRRRRRWDECRARQARVERQVAHDVAVARERWVALYE